MYFQAWPCSWCFSNYDYNFQYPYTGPVRDSNEYLPGERTFLQLALHQCAQSGEAMPQIVLLGGPIIAQTSDTTRTSPVSTLPSTRTCALRSWM